MKEDLLKQLLESILGRSKSARGGDEAVFYCPSCNHHKKKLTFNLQSQKYQCWVCGYKGHRAYQLLRKANSPSSICDPSIGQGRVLIHSDISPRSTSSIDQLSPTGK